MAGIRANVDLNVNTNAAKRSMERAAAEINKIVNNVSGKNIAFNVNGKSFTQPLGRITASANEFTKSLEASNARVIAFGASVGIINGITDSFKFLVAETVKFEKTLTNPKKRMFSYIYEINSKFSGALHSDYYPTDAGAASAEV